jgi:hypothetical protein
MLHARCCEEQYVVILYLSPRSMKLKVNRLAPMNGHACHLVRDLAVVVVERSASLALLRKGQLLRLYLSST